MKSISKKHLIESVVCTVAAVITFSIITACGGSPNPITNIVGAAGRVAARLSIHPKAHSSIHPGSGSGGNFLAALFQTAPVASQLPESYEGTCDFTGDSPAVLAGGFATLNVPNGEQCSPGTVTVSQTLGTDQVGIEVAFAGTITTLKISVVTSTNQRFRCVVLNGNAAVNDNDLIQPYYNFTTNTGVIGDGTTQLPISCQVPIPAGQTAQKLTMEWSKI